MPVNRNYPLKEVVAAMRMIPLQSGRKVTAEYVLLAGVNDSTEDALSLSRLFRGGRIKVNLIPYNPHEASPHRAPEADAVDRFRNVLVAGGVQTIKRERRGADIRAACGQLSGSVHKYRNM
jgi:23S rRNA (adenine2503-C2)-methyltransferase